MLYWGDIGLYFEPMQHLVNTELHAGRVPLWNPYILCGQPLLGNPQMAVFYPLSLLAPAMSAPVFLSIATITHIFLCGVFMYAFLLSWSKHRVSAILGGLTYMGSACIVSRIQFPPMVLSAPYAPLLLLCLDGVISNPRSKRRLLALSTCVALLVLAAHPQVAYLSTLIAMVYGIWRVANNRFTGSTVTSEYASPQTDFVHHRSGRTVTSLIAAFVLGVGIAGIQIIPMLQLMKVSSREHMTPYVANRFVFDLSHLATLIYPGTFGSPGTGDYHGGGNAWEPAIFVGWIPLVFILSALFRSIKHPNLRFWSILGLVNIWLATGLAGGLFWVAFYAIPGLSSFHDPARFLFLTTICMCVMTAAGCDQLLHKLKYKQGATYNALIVWATAIPLLVYGVQWNPTRSPIHDHFAVSQQHTGRSYLPAHEVYWQRFISDGYTDYGTDREYRAMLSTGLANSEETRNIETAAGYEPVPLQAQAELDGLARIAFKRGEPTLLSYMQLMDASDMYLPVYHRIFSADFAEKPLPRGTDVRIAEPAGGVSRGWLVRSAIEVDGKTRSVSTISAPEFDPRTLAIVSRPLPHNALNLPEYPQPDAELVHPVTSRSDVSGSVWNFDIRAGKSAGYFVISIACCPGWGATIDGQPATLICTDGAFMGLPVPPGNHAVRVDYRPASVKLGAYVSLLCAGIFAGLLAVGNGKCNGGQLRAPGNQ